MVLQDNINCQGKYDIGSSTTKPKLFSYLDSDVHSSISYVRWSTTEESRECDLLYPSFFPSNWSCDLTPAQTVLTGLWPAQFK
jgi:hypothetical protein